MPPTPKSKTRLAHWNSRGLVNKATIFKKKLTDHDISLCGVVEAFTYRDSHLSDENRKWDPGVEVRPTKIHKHPPGGIGFMASRSIVHSIVAAGRYSAWARIDVEGGVPIFQCEAYFPHSNKTRQHRAAWREIAQRAREYAEIGHVVVLGDFNAHTGINGGKQDYAGRLLLRQAKELGLKVLNGTDLCTGGHTREVEHEDGTSTATTIDFVMVSQSILPHVAGLTVLEDRMGSDHHMLVLELLGLQPKAAAKAELREVWRVENIPHYKDPRYKDLVKAYQTAFRGWRDAAEEATARMRMERAGEGECNTLEKSFQEFLDDVSLEQIGRKLIGPKSSPFMTPHVKRLNDDRRDREVEQKRARSDPCCSSADRASAVEAYRHAKAAVMTAIRERRDELEREMFEQIESSQADSKLFWTHVKRSVAGGLLSSVSPPPMALNSAGGVETDPLEVLKVWREFSAGIASPGSEEEGIYDEEHKSEVEAKLERLRLMRHYQPALDSPITREEIFAAIRRLKSGTAPGVDGVTTTILKMAADAVGTSKLKADNPVVDSLAILFNFVFENERWPERWATGIVFPLYKQDSRLDPGNYRPITLLSVVGKLFGSVVESRLSQWAEGCFALADEQGGFRRSRGTPDLIFLLREIILTREMRGQPTLATFIDARKAYDTVWREGNFVRLHDMGVRGKLWRQLQSMSADPKSKIRLPFGETEYFKVTRGVAQGAVESPFLYACFINGLAEELKSKGLGITIAAKHTPLLMYADDVVFLAGSVDELRSMNEVVTNYAKRNRYRLNGDKSAVMAFNADPALDRAVRAEPWRLSGEVVEVKDSYKYLGVDVLKDVRSWKSYIERAIAKATRVSEDLQWACRRAGGLRPRAAAALWKAIVRPVLEYAAEIWSGELTLLHARRAEAVQTDFARCMLGLVGCQSISNDALRAELGMEKLSSRWEKLRLGYWRRLHVASGERTLVAVASLRRKHLLWGYNGAEQGWMRETRDLLVRRGMLNHWLNPSLCASQTKDEWRDLCYQAVELAEGAALRGRFASMSGDAAGRYARIKNWEKVTSDFAVMKGEIGELGAHVIEPYLDGRDEQVGTRLKLMCRLGCLPTLARVAREEKLPPGQGECRLCDSPEPEDISHLLLDCAGHARHREKMLRAVEHELALAGTASLNSMPHAEQVDVLLGKSTGIAMTDVAINRGVVRYLKKAWRGRKWLTASLNKALSRDDTVWALRAHGDGPCRVQAPRPRSCPL